MLEELELHVDNALEDVSDVAKELAQREGSATGVSGPRASHLM